MRKNICLFQGLGDCYAQVSVTASRRWRVQPTYSTLEGGRYLLRWFSMLGFIALLTGWYGSRKIKCKYLLFRSILKQIYFLTRNVMFDEPFDVKLMVMSCVSCTCFRLMKREIKHGTSSLLFTKAKNRSQIMTRWFLVSKYFCCVHIAVTESATNRGKSRLVF